MRQWYNAQNKILCVNGGERIKKRIADFHAQLFSEREHALRNRAFSHGFWVLATLIVIDHFLPVLGITLPFGAGLGLLFVAVAGTVVMLEAIICGVYFPRRVAPAFRLAFMLLVVFFAGGRLAMSLHNPIAAFLFERFPFAAPFLDPLGYGRRVESILFFSLLLLLSVCGTIRAVYDMRKARAAHLAKR